MSINNSKLILSPPLQQNIIDPGTRMPAVGSVYFYKSGTSVLKAVYQRSNDPDNPYVAAPNPLPLNSAGALPFSIFAYPVNEADETTLELYDLVVKNSNNVEILRINKWPETASQQSTTINPADDFIVNGQFNYPIKFYTDSNEIDQITLTSTAVCPAWKYETDCNLKLIKRYVEFEELLNSKEIHLPKYLCIVNGTNIDTTESYSHLSQTIGTVETLAGQEITCSFFGQDRNGNGAQIEVYLRRVYGPTGSGASTDDDLLIGAFTVTSTLSKFTTSFNVPSLEGKTVGEPSALELYFSYPTGTAYKIALTTVIARRGAVSDPDYLDIPPPQLNAQILGESSNLQGRSNADNFAPYINFNGDTLLQQQTGQFFKVSNKSVQQNMEVLTSTKKALAVDGSNKYNVPYRNLFNVIGTDWGSDGDLSITAKDNVVTFKGIISGDPVNGYDKGYNVGDAKVTKKIVEKSNKYSVNAVVSAGNPSSIELSGNLVPGGFDNGVVQSAPWYPKFDYRGTNNVLASSNIITTCTKQYTCDLTGSAGPATYEKGSGILASIIDNSHKTPIKNPVFKGSLDAKGSTSQLANAVAGWYWLVDVPGTLLGEKLEVNDEVVCTSNVSGTPTDFTHFTVSKPWKTTLVFSENDPKGFQSDAAAFTPGNQKPTFHFSLNAIAFGTNSYNLGYIENPSKGVTQPNKLFVHFTVDGQGSYVDNGLSKDVVCPVALKSTDTIEVITKKIVNAISNPFTITFTIDSVPVLSAGNVSPYFEYSAVQDPNSSSNLQFYVWFKVDGVGVDPKPSGGTGKLIEINSSDSLSTVAKKIADGITGSTFNIPSYSDIGMTPTQAEQDKNSVVIVL